MTVLMAIGGNMRLDGEIAREFLRRSGGGDARLVVIPAASSRVSGGHGIYASMAGNGYKNPTCDSACA